MKVVILAGGKGVRYNTDKPKALAMVGDKPIILHLMNLYSCQGYKNFIVAVGWKQEEIIKYMKIINTTYSIEFVDTGQHNNTAKRLKIIEKYIPSTDENFFCTYSDGLSNVNLSELQKKHSTYNNIATLTAVRPINQFGTLCFDDHNNIIEFKEKPKMTEYINGGFFIFNKKIFDYININKNQELEKDILTYLAIKNKLGSYKHEGFWETINTPKDESRLNELYKKRINNNELLDWLKY